MSENWKIYMQGLSVCLSVWWGGPKKNYFLIMMIFVALEKLAKLALIYYQDADCEQYFTKSL